MSQKQIQQQVPNPLEQQLQKRLNELLQQAESPIILANSQAQKTSLNIINQICNQIVGYENQFSIQSQKILRLEKLLDDNKITHKAQPPTPPNRATRREEERKQKKQVKKN